MKRAVSLFGAMLAVAVAASAADVRWSELSQVLKGKTITVGTDGKSYRGRFISSSPDFLVLKTPREVKIPRDAVKSIYRKGRESRFLHLKNLCLIVMTGYAFPFTDPQDPALPLLALFTIPAATAVGAVAAPIDLVLDLADLGRPPREVINVLPDRTTGALDRRIRNRSWAQDQ